MIVGQLEAFDPPNRFNYTWKLLAIPETSMEKPSRITYEIAEKENQPRVCTLTVIHDRFEHAPNTYRFVGNS